MIKCGIYKIVNIVNDKIYIGQSVNVDKRVSNHKYKLKNNSHYNKHLQFAINKYGLSSFKFETIEICNEEDLNKREMYWISFYKSNDRELGYNIQEPSDNLEYKVSEETRVKISKLQIKYSDDELLNMITDYFLKYDRVPNMNDFTNEYKGLITGDRVKARFKGYKRAICKSDVLNMVEEFKQCNGYYNRELLLKFMLNWIRENKRVPTQIEINKDENMPSVQPYLCEFESWNEVIILCGCKPTRNSNF